MTQTAKDTQEVSRLIKEEKAKIQKLLRTLKNKSNNNGF